MTQESLNAFKAACYVLLTVGVLFLVYYIANLLREATATIKKVNSEIEKIDKLVTDITDIVTTVKTSFSGFFFGLSKGLSAVASVISFFKKKKKEDKSDE